MLPNGYSLAARSETPTSCLCGRMAFHCDGDGLAVWDLAPVDVLVTHAPPRGVLDRAQAFGCVWGRSHGSEDLRKFVDTTRPLFHLFGHVHHAAGGAKRPSAPPPRLGRHFLH